jgi:hypothetical protein
MQNWNEIATKEGIADAASQDLAIKLDFQSVSFRQDFLIPSIGAVIDPSLAKSMKKCTSK